MTPTEQARALLESLLANYSSNSYDTLKEVDDAFNADVALITAALAQARREVWESAAKGIVERMRGPLEMPLSNRSKGYNDAVIELSVWCREQREKEEG